MQAQTATQRNLPRQASSTLVLFFALAYLSHGVSAQFGLIAQPIQYFMMRGLHLSAADVSSVLALLMLPWVIKPFYGLICDFVPLFGYRRKSYVIGANLLTAAGFLVICLNDSLAVVTAALLCTALGMAISTALMVGLAIERGRDDGKVRDYFGSQAFWYYAANILAVMIGGFLCHALTPVAALHTAAAVAMLPVLAVSWLGTFMISEEKSQVDSSGIRQTWDSLRSALRSSKLWLVAVFFGWWHFTPAFGVPLYFYESNTLGFSQSFIGQLAACSASGMLVGAVAHRCLLQSRAIKVQLLVSTFAISLCTLSYLLLADGLSAMILELSRGIVSMTALLSLYALAAEVCPRRVEVSVMALLFAVKNIATEASTFAGGQLFTHIFHDAYRPLVLCSGALTASGAIIALLLYWRRSGSPMSESPVASSG